MQLLEFIEHQKPNVSIVLRADNKRAINLTANPEFHPLTKHIAVQQHWIQDAVLNKEITILYISTNKMIAD